MAEATSITCKRINTVGEYSEYELKSTCSNGETVTIPTEHTEITTSSKVQVIAVNNLSDGTGAGVCSVVYTAASRLFTVTDAGASDDDVRIIFKVSNA
jgi:hypothetical protein